jgi:ATP-binding cassette, subfamily C, bacterial CydD
MLKLYQKPTSLGNGTLSSELEWLHTIHHCCRRWVVSTVVLGVVVGIGSIVQAGLLAYVIHAALIETIAREALLPFFISLAGVICLRSALTWGREICGQRSSTLARRYVRRRLSEHLKALGPIYVRNQQAAPLAATVIDRVEALHGYFAHYRPQQSLAVIVPLMIVLTAFSVSWAVGVIFLITAPLVPLFMIMIGRGAERLNQKSFQMLSRMSAHFLDTLQGLPTLKLFQRSQDESERIAASSERYRQGTMAVLRVAFQSAAVLEFLTSVAIAMTAVFLGLSYLHYIDFGLYARELTLQTGLFLLLLAPELYLPLRELGTHYHARAEALGAAEALVAILAEKPSPQPADGGVVLPNQPVALELRGIRYDFDHREQPALRHLHLRVNAGEWLAIVGPSGAGKTTLLNLLLGFLPLQQGTILVNSRSLSELNLADWQRRIAWVPQQPTLFFGSLAENIALGDPDLTTGEIAAAAQLARLHEFTGCSAEGLATEVGEQGNRLSGGQARRVALARAFARKASLILLDEPTAGLDRENERLVMDSLLQLVQQKTVIMSTHRLDTARSADRIAVMAEGAVVEQGRHDELMALGGVYAGLIESGRQVWR